MEVKKEKLKEILDALGDAEFCSLNDNCFYEQVIQPFKENYKHTFSYETGATKGVLIFPDLDFVIKIPFTYNSDDDELCGADDSGPGWNYCEVEEIKCQKAKIFGVEGCFAETILVGEICNYPIYAQEKATVFTQGGSPSPKKSDEEYDRIEDMCDGMAECFNRVWLSDAFDYFGEKTFYELLSFIDEYDISDLHDANIGYIGMRPVLVDYSSFND